jgi:transposase-like protein
MIYFGAIWAALMHYYTKCPHCGRTQRFNGKKDGEIVACHYCGHQFTLKRNKNAA